MARRLRPAVVREGQSVVFLRKGKYMLALGPVHAEYWQINYDYDPLYFAGRLAPVANLLRSGTIDLRLRAVLPDARTMKIAGKVVRAERKRLAKEAKAEAKRKAKR